MPAFSVPTFTEHIFKKLNEAKEITMSDHPKIQRVPHHLRDPEKFEKYYSPKLVSFGPIHYGEPHLQLGEEYKHLWASKFLQANNKSAEQVHQKIQEKIEDLRGLYTEDVVRELNDEKLSGILFVDGCSLLQILQTFDSSTEVLKVKIDQLALVCQDVILLENQLPFLLLVLLTSRSDAMNAMDKFTKYFLHLEPLHQPLHNFSLPMDNEDNHPCPFPPHLLHQLRRKLLCDFCPNFNPNTPVVTFTYRNIKELKKVGIQVKRSQSLGPFNISFDSNLFDGQLNLPKIEVDHSTAPTYMNMIAYERCPDFENFYEISSYVQFLNSLIDHPNDVEELRAAGILYNGLGSDQEVTNLFNTISTNVVPIVTYAPIIVKIEAHCQKKYKTWAAQAYNTYFNSPWAILGFYNALFALSFAAAQTLLTVFPPKSKSQ